MLLRQKLEMMPVATNPPLSEKPERRGIEKKGDHTRLGAACETTTCAFNARGQECQGTITMIAPVYLTLLSFLTM
jgi:hypothetical protein